MLTICRKDFMSIHPAETLPLLLSMAIIVQGIVFIAVPSGFLKSMIDRGCSSTAQIIWPGKA